MKNLKTKIDTIQFLLDKGLTIAEVAMVYECKYVTINKLVREFRLECKSVDTTNQSDLVLNGDVLRFVLKCVADNFSIATAVLTKPNRSTGDLVYYRGLAYKLLYNTGRFSWPVLGKFFKKHHVSVIGLAKRIDDDDKHYVKLKKIIEERVL